MTIETTTKGEGLLFVDASLWEDLGKPDTPEAWHTAILLPESYEIVHIGLPTLHDNRYTLHVRHEAIPMVAGAAHRPVVLLHHEVTFDGEHKQVFLHKVEIRQWNGTRWIQAAVTDRRGIDETTRL
jgi:hypothetical protein